MTTITAAMVKELREKTSTGIMDCKQALKENDGDMEKAVDFLRKKGLATAEKRAGREASEGIIHAYIHSNGKIGVLVEVNCESDFVAKNDDFLEFANNIAMHIAATNPAGINDEDVPAAVIEKEREIYLGQAMEMGKPENVAQKIVEGKIKKFYKDNCLMSQVYVRDTDLTITDVLNELVAKIGEKIVISKFSRYQIGE